MTETKPTNGLLTHRLNNTDQKTDNLTNNRRIETHQWQMTNFTRVFQPIPSWLNWPITFNGLYNIIDWQILFTWLWRWLPLRLSKRQSPTTVLFRTTLTQTITQYELMISNGRRMAVIRQCFEVLRFPFMQSTFCFSNIAKQTGTLQSTDE